MIDRSVAGAAKYERELEAHGAMSGLPDLRLLPDAPVPDGRAVLTAPDKTPAGDGLSDQATPAAFHTAYEPVRVDARNRAANLPQRQAWQSGATCTCAGPSPGCAKASASSDP